MNMKSIVFSSRLLLSGLVLFVFAFQACKSGQNGKDGGKSDPDVGARAIPLPPALDQAFQEDAHRLALRELVTRNTSVSTDRLFITEERIKYYFNLLAQAFEIWNKDESIPDLSHIRTFKSPDMRRILVILDKDAPFRDAWSEGEIKTSDPKLNELTEKLNLSIKEYRDSQMGATLILESDRFYNTVEMANRLSEIKGIRLAEPDGKAGDGNNITAGAEGKNHLALKFSVGAGDCPSGCIYRKYWTFHVGPDGKLAYVGVSGSIPENMDEED